MKKFTLFLLLSMVIVFSAEAQNYGNRNSRITISTQTFYDQLSPYGDWIYSHDYGYVWRPYFDNPESFRPYSSNGNWVYTSYGWTWVSDYDWGWATFHYGRWDFDNYLGWLWIPGQEWAPAWVTWGSYDNYWGWAPMGPNIYAQSNTGWHAPDPWWTFVPRNQFCSNNWNHYIYDRPVHVTNITYINNVYVGNNYNTRNRNSWYEGPQVADVERYNKRRIRTIQITDNQRPERTVVRNNSLNVYRPTVDASRNAGRPAEFRNAESVRTGNRIAQTNARTNDPGVNRVRNNRTENRITEPTPAQRNGAVTREKRTDPRSSNQEVVKRTGNTSREIRATTPTASQSESRNVSMNRETRVEPSTGSREPATRNAGQPLNTNRNEANRVVKNTRVTERTTSSTGVSREANPIINEPRKSSPDPGNRSNASPRTIESRQTPAVQPVRENRTIVVTPSTNTRAASTQRQQQTGEIQRSATPGTSDKANRSTSKSPSRR